MIYLACPYSHPDPKVQKMRADTATKVATQMIQSGTIVFSPLTYTAAMQKLGVHKTSKGWLLFLLPFMEACTSMYVLTLAGWQESIGVTDEIKFFREKKKPFFLMSPDYGDSTIITTWG